MKALFVTTKTVDCLNHVRAWDSWAAKSVHTTFDPGAIRNDWRAVEVARETKPDVIFYIGAFSGIGNPRIATFQELRQIAPLINLCSDAGDRPWHNVLRDYKRKGCFDLQVAIDGARDAPVDLATLTPVDPAPFSFRGTRDIRCGFSGTVGIWNPRSEVVNALLWFSDLTVRKTSTAENSYYDHARFLGRCEMLLNVSNTGTGQANHIKGRVMEAGMAGCALLEDANSPIGDWFPDDCFLRYQNPKDAADIIESAPSDLIENTAMRLTEEIKARYMPKHIYGEILDHVRYTVALSPS